MSNLVVQVSKVEKIVPHLNSDRLEIITIGGWDTVVPKNEFKENDKVVFIPYDTLLTKESAEKLGVTKYLRGKENNRVGHINLRGQKSYGIVTKPLDDSWPIGKEVAEFYGATKYIPPINNHHFNAKNANREKEDPRLGKYTDIENIKHYKTLMNDGETVFAFEKIHGTSSAIGSINGKIKCRSKGCQRKTPTQLECGFGKKVNYFKYFWMKIKELFSRKIDIEACKQNWWWFPYSIEGVQNFLIEEGKKFKVVILYGETYGNVQFLKYGVKQTEENPSGLAFAAFDIKIDGQYINKEDFIKYCEQYKIPYCPIIYKGPYDLDHLKSICNKAKTVLGNGEHCMEGLVVSPEIERNDNHFGRVVLKIINDEYLDLLGDRDTTDA